MAAVVSGGDGSGADGDDAEDVEPHGCIYTLFMSKLTAAAATAASDADDGGVGPDDDDDALLYEHTKIYIK